MAIAPDLRLNVVDKVPLIVSCRYWVASLANLTLTLVSRSTAIADTRNINFERFLGNPRWKILRVLMP